MSLQVWLPLNGNLHNQGVSSLQPVQTIAPTYVNGKIGKAMSTGAFYLPAAEVAKFYNNNTMSWAFWIYPTTSGSVATPIIGQSNTGAGDCRMFTIFQYPNGVDLHLSWQIEAGGNAFLASILSNAFTVNTWNHCVITYDGSTVRIYINGDIKATYTNIVSNRSNFNYNVPIPNSSSRYLNDLRIYDHCLSAKEVKEISKGLVVHYPLNDTAIESTTNLGNYLNDAFDGVSQKYRFGENTNIYKDDGVFQNRQCSKVRIGSAGQTIHPYVSFPNLHPAQNTYKTVSFDYYPTSVNTIQFYSWSGSATAIYQVNNGPVTSGSTIPVNLNQWNHIRLTLYGTSDKTGGWGWMKIGTSPITSTTSDYWLFANIQVEAKDHETAYTDTTRANNIIYDTSGYNNHGIINGTVECNTDTPRYSVCTDFNKSGYIIKDAFNTYTHQFTFNIWINPKSISSQHFLFGTFTSWTKNGIGIWRDSGYSHYSWLIKSDSESSYSSSNLTYTLNTWNMLTLVYTGVNLLGYVNGIQQFNSTYGSGGVVNNPVFMIANSKYNKTPASENEEAYISDVRFYATALTADQIKELYQTSASIDKNGNMYAYEYVEQ